MENRLIVECRDVTLIALTYADGKGTAYAYMPGGKLATRAWARQTGGGSLVTTYSYNTAGEMTGVDYSDATPDVTNTFDRIGRQASIIDGSGARTFSYTNTLALVAEELASSLPGTPSHRIDRLKDSLGRDAGFVMSSGGNVLSWVGYGYDQYGRFASVTWTNLGIAGSAEYSRLADSDLIAGWESAMPGSSLSISKGYEANRDLITYVENRIGTNVISRYDYIDDESGRRTSVIITSGTNNGASASPSTPFFAYRNSWFCSLKAA